MSLDVYLMRKKWVSYDELKSHKLEHEEVYWANITHNLSGMAKNAGIYQALWRPEEIGAEKAGDIIEILEKGLNDLVSKPEHFKQFNSPNGWGTYDNFVRFVENYLNACKENKNAMIFISR